MKDEGRYYYPEDGGEKASKYAFYVELSSIEGLIMGQHVYIEPGMGSEGEPNEGIPLPSYYLSEENGKPFVYAANAEDRIEKRFVTTGSTDEMTGNVMILSGLDCTDRIAFPDETVKVGMAVSETVYVPDNGSGLDMNKNVVDDKVDMGMIDSVPFEGEIGMDMTGEPAVPADMDYSGEMISEPIEAPAAEPEAGGNGQ